jgi:hypothetical protein
MRAQRTQLLGLEHDVAVAAGEERQRRAAGVVFEVAALRAEQGIELPVVRVSQGRVGAALNSVVVSVRGADAAAVAGAGAPAASGSASSSSTSVRSASLLAAEWFSSKPPKKPPHWRAPGARRSGASCTMAIACSCCRRSLGRPRVKPSGSPPARTSRPCHCNASVAKPTPWRSEPITHHGWRPSIAWFWREAITVATRGCTSGEWST